ncbi:MAG: hypothetical protein R3A78_05525 [Polyangiales bacterium]
MSQRRRTGSAQIEQLVMLFLVGTAGVVGFAGLGGAFDHAIGARGGFASPATPVAAVHASTAASVSAQAGLGPVAREALRAAEAATRSDKLAAAATVRVRWRVMPNALPVATRLRRWTRSWDGTSFKPLDRSSTRDVPVHRSATCSTLAQAF